MSRTRSPPRSGCPLVGDEWALVRAGRHAVADPASRWRRASDANARAACWGCSPTAFRFVHGASSPTSATRARLEGVHALAASALARADVGSALRVGRHRRIAVRCAPAPPSARSATIGGDFDDVAAPHAPRRIARSGGDRPPDPRSAWCAHRPRRGRSAATRSSLTQLAGAWTESTSPEKSTIGLPCMPPADFRDPATYRSRPPVLAVPAGKLRSRGYGDPSWARFFRQRSRTAACVLHLQRQHWAEALEPKIADALVRRRQPGELARAVLRRAGLRDDIEALHASTGRRQAARAL